MKAASLRFLMNLYPPFIGAGVRILHISDDYLAIDVRLKPALRPPAAAEISAPATDLTE